MFELTAKTEAGARLVRIAEALAEEFASRAAIHDREASFPHAGIDALKRAGYFTAPIPAEQGGLGVTSVHDLVVASSRLARGDASIAIGVNMHLIVLLNIVRRWQAAVAAGNERRAAAFAASMDAVTGDGVVIAAAVSELGQDLTRPRTTATRTPAGWRIDGRKAFCTGSPAASVLYTAVMFVDEDGVERYGYAQIPPETPGVEIHDDWDALGMRASGSHSVTFAGVHVPGAALRGGFVAGDADAYMERNLFNGLFHAAASLGIAESAASAATDALAARGEPDPRARTLIAENAVELGAARATLSRSATLADDSDRHVGTLFADTQAAKAFVTEAAVRIVDRALALSGGAGYLNGHPLARAYRDVRAGGFMHPLGANRAYELLADVALGREHALH
ncbi:MAG TPA: acyl-CoA dehydrogenase family protein [Solirubrobacteraceae bacterium]|nr:acyl-CoA dehydrogenase family protein [Solirubrobacteraceae bacterium]